MALLQREVGWGRHLARSLRLLLAFLLPLVAMNALVDPFGRAPALALALPGREELALKRAPHLVVALALPRARAPVVLVGDSRVGLIGLAAEEVSTWAGRRVFSAALGGSTLPEVVASLRQATRAPHTREVLVGLSFDQWDGRGVEERIGPAARLVESPLAYYLSGFVTRASLELLLRGAPEPQPPPPREWFWQAQLGGARQRLRCRVPPQRAADDLAAAVAEARARGVAVRFFVPPTHVDLQALPAELGLTGERAAFLSALAALGPTLDFDRPTDLTRAAARFTDPFHATSADARLVLLVLLGLPGAPAGLATPLSDPAAARSPP